MQIASRAKAILARLTAQAYGRPVARADLERELALDGASRAEAQSAWEELLQGRDAREAEGGLLPTSPPLATRAPEQIASFSRLHR